MSESRNRRLIRQMKRIGVTEAEECSCVVDFYALPGREQESYLQSLEWLERVGLGRATRAEAKP